MKQYKILNAQWEPLPAELAPAQSKLEAVLESWRGTPYISGQRLRGVGCDCIGGVFGVIDDIDGRPRAQNPLLPADTSMHSPKLAYRAVATMRRIYAPAKRVSLRSGTIRIQPGDLLVVGTERGGPGHLMIAGPRRNTIWHAAGRGACFCQAGWGLGAEFSRLFAVYRLGDRERWV